MALASLNNFVDDKTFSAFATTASRLTEVLESKSEVVIDWFKKNKMTVNPNTFQTVILDKRKVITLTKVLLLIISKLKFVICQTFKLTIRQQTEV